AAVDVASLRVAPQLAGGHILDHTLAQRADGGISAHGELLLSEVGNTSFSSGRGSPPRYKRALNSLPTPPTGTPAQRLSRQRFSALCRFLGRLHDVAIHVRRRQASEKRQGTKSRLVGSGGAAGSMGIWPQQASLGWCT